MWWFEYRDIRGERVRRSTGQKKRGLAQAVADRLEREALGAAPVEMSVTTAVAKLLATLERKKRAPDTLQFTLTKGKNVIRLLGELDINRLTRADVERFMDIREEEGVALSTVGKELGVLRQALRLLAKHDVDGLPIYSGDTRRLFPEGVIGSYTPRERALSHAEYVLLRAQLKPNRQDYLAAYVGLGVRASELARITPADVRHDDGGGASQVRVRGTKTVRSDRTLPIAPDLGPMFARRAAETQPGWPLFPTWANMRRDLHEATDRAEIPRVSPNDLRRTFATWLAERGVPEMVTASMLGHTSSSMVRSVYTHIGTPAQHDAVSVLPALGGGAPNADSAPPTGACCSAQPVELADAKPAIPNSATSYCAVQRSIRKADLDEFALRACSDPAFNLPTRDARADPTVPLIVSDPHERGDTGGTTERGHHVENTEQSAISQPARRKAAGTALAKRRTTRRKAKNPALREVSVVPRPGIEPGTRGFSIPCSTD